MDDSILDSIKKLLGLSADYDAFDTDVMLNINSFLSVLHQVGATPEAGFQISGREEKWSDFLIKPEQVSMLKTYIYMRVKLAFDPPVNSFGIDSLKKTADELEWRLSCLEIVFNPTVYDFAVEPSGDTVWKVVDGEFPEEAEFGAIGVDLETGDVWKKA